MAMSLFLLGIPNVSKSINIYAYSFRDKTASFRFSCISFPTPLNFCNVLSTRKSYEFEDLLQSSTDSCRVDWYAQSRLGLTRTLSEENVYEDIIGTIHIFP